MGGKGYTTNPIWGETRSEWDVTTKTRAGTGACPYNSKYVLISHGLAELSERTAVWFWTPKATPAGRPRAKDNIHSPGRRRGRKRPRGCRAWSGRRARRPPVRAGPADY